MSYWAPVKIRDTPRFSTATLLIGLRSRYLRLASLPRFVHTPNGHNIHRRVRLAQPR
jgi:hypothetical protein